MRILYFQADTASIFSTLSEEILKIPQTKGDNFFFFLLVLVVMVSDVFVC